MIVRGNHLLLVLVATLLPNLGSPTQPHARARLVPVIAAAPVTPGQPGISKLGVALPLLAHGQGPHFLDDTSGQTARAKRGQRAAAPLQRSRPGDGFQVARSARAPPAR